MSYSGKIPFDPRDEQLISYVDKYTESYGIPTVELVNGEYVHETIPISWRDNIEFYDILRYTGFERGRSSINFIFIDSDGNKVPMFAKDFSDMVLQCSIVGGQVKGKWTYAKRGANYGIQYVKEDN